MGLIGAGNVARVDDKKEKKKKEKKRKKKDFLKRRRKKQKKKDSPYDQMDKERITQNHCVNKIASKCSVVTCLQLIGFLSTLGSLRLLASFNPSPFWNLPPEHNPLTLSALLVPVSDRDAEKPRPSETEKYQTENNAQAARNSSSRAATATIVVVVGHGGHHVHVVAHGGHRVHVVAHGGGGRVDCSGGDAHVKGVELLHHGGPE